MKVVDRFHILRRAIEQVNNRARTSDLLSSAHGAVRDAFMAEIKKAQPVDTTMAYKPSIRRGYTPIASGWGRGLVIEKTGKGITLSLKSVSKHLKWQRFGTDKKSYPIPGVPTGMYFWWGAPLPWTPTMIPELVERSPGMFWFSQIMHPGIEAYGGSDFVRRAWMEVRAQAMERFKETAKTILFQPFRDMR